MSPKGQSQWHYANLSAHLQCGLERGKQYVSKYILFTYNAYEKNKENISKRHCSWVKNFCVLFGINKTLIKDIYVKKNPGHFKIKISYYNYMESINIWNGD